MMEVIIRKHELGKRAYPIEKAEAEQLVADGKAVYRGNHVYEEKAAAATYQTRNMEAEPTPQPEPEKVVDLADKTVKELREIAKEHGIEGYGKLKKKDLIRAIEVL